METVLHRYVGKFDGLSEPAYIITNSERSSYSCPRFWALEYVQSMDSGEKSKTLSYGIIVHQLLEYFLASAKDEDRILSLDEMIDIHRKTTPDLLEKEFDGNVDEEFQNHCMDNIGRSLIGWRNNWLDIWSKWMVIGVELDVYAPIKNADGSNYREQIPCIEMTIDGEVYTRPARQGEMKADANGDVDLMLSPEEIELLQKAGKLEVKTIEMPVYIAGRIDVLLRNREEPKELAVLDHKTTSALWKYEKQAPFDIQLPTYAYLVERGANLGDMGDLSGCKVTTVMYDLLHSKIPSPKPLKSGKLSTRSSCPSWVLEAKIAELDLDRTDYLELIEDLKLSDSKYFNIVSRDLFDDDTARIEGELKGITQSMIQRRQKIAKISLSEKSEFDAIVPRQPSQCIVWGNCKFSEICLNNNQNYGSIKERPRLHWLTNPSLTIGEI